MSSACSMSIRYKSKTIHQKMKSMSQWSSVQSFPGAALMKYLDSHVRYPEEAAKDGVQGRVMVEFVIEKDGSIGDVRVLTGLNRDCDKEAIRVVKSMPKWCPAENNGAPVRSYFMLPITFRL